MCEGGWKRAGRAWSERKLSTRHNGRWSHTHPHFPIFSSNLSLLIRLDHSPMPMFARARNRQLIWYQLSDRSYQISRLFYVIVAVPGPPWIQCSAVSRVALQHTTSHQKSKIGHVLHSTSYCSATVRLIPRYGAAHAFGATPLSPSISIPRWYQIRLAENRFPRIVISIGYLVVYLMGLATSNSSADSRFWQRQDDQPVPIRIR